MASLLNAIKNVIRGHPFLVQVDDEEPDAAHEVNVHEQEKDDLEEPDRVFDILFHIQIHYDFVQPEEADHLQNAKQRKVLSRTGVDERSSD